MPSIAAIKKIKGKYTASLLKLENVIGTGIGKKIVKGEITEELCLKVYVTTKKAKAQLKEEDIVKNELDGIKTDVVGIGRVISYGDNQ